MTTVRFLHTADWQLGMTRHFLGTEAQARFTAARVDAVRAIGALADELRCAFVVVCGDVFESNHIDRQVLVRALDAMRAVPVPLFLLPGNHDPRDAASVYRSETFRAHVPDQVRVLESFEPVQAAADVWLLPAPWSSKRPLEDLTARALAAETDGGLRVLVGHGIVDALSPDAGDPALIRLAALEAAIGEGRLHYAALGDRHSATDVGTTGCVWYSGSPEATDYGEIDTGQALIVEMTTDSGDPVRVTRHPIGRWRFERQMHVVNTTDDIETLTSALEAGEAKDRTVLKLGFEGTLSVRDKVRLDELLDHARDLYAGVELWQRRTDLAVLPEDGDFDGLGLTGFAADALKELRDTAARGDEEGLVAQDALALLVRLAGGQAS